MARICEKNTCPTGIATHDPKFKAKYKGHKDHVVDTLKYLAEDVRRVLASMGETNLQDIIGKSELLSINGQHLDLINELNLDLSFFMDAPAYHKAQNLPGLSEPISPLNTQIVNDLEADIAKDVDIEGEYEIINTDRSALATLFGKLADNVSKVRLAGIKGEQTDAKAYSKIINLTFRGSAGQSFGVFQTEGVNLRLIGEANDSVCKSMSGGKTVIVPSPKATYKPEENAIIGNCALYGATNGKFYVYGQAGDRFAVRNSGATAVVEGTGLHACEYMTNGTVVVLGETSNNIGAGMTGGELFLFEDPGTKVNKDYISKVGMSEHDFTKLHAILLDYEKETGSNKAKYILSDWEQAKDQFHKYMPISMITIGQNDSEESPIEDETDKA